MKDINRFWIGTYYNKHIILFNTISKKFISVNTDKIYEEDELYLGEDIFKSMPIEIAEEILNIHSDNGNEITSDYLINKVFDQNILKITIVLGYKCNLACSYCYESRQENIDININVDKITTFIKEYCRLNKINKVAIEFYGGEPIVYFKELIDISKNMKEYFKEKYSFTIMTNGTLLTKEKIDIMKNLGLKKIEISIDGNEVVHNNRRPMINGNNSFKTIVKNIIQLKDEINIVIRINIDKENSAYVDELLDVLEKYKLKESIFIYFTNVINCSNNCSEDDDSINLLPDMYVKAFERKFNIPFRIYAIGPCHLHKKNSFGLKPNGDLVKCLAVDSFIGNINKNFNPIQKRRDYTEKCKSCALFPICFGGCKYEYSDENGICPINMFNKLLPKYLKAKFNISKEA